jgi:integrase
MWRDPETGAGKESWVIDIELVMPDGKKSPRVRKVSPIQTRRGAEDYERSLRQSLLDGTYGKEVSTFAEWWNGRYWKEWVVGQKNKPSTVEAKRSNYKNYLERAFGSLRLDEIDVGRVARFKASLIEKKLSDKTVNNILADLSKPLRYAADVEIITKAPRIGLLRVEASEIVAWEIDEYARLVTAAARLDETVLAAVCLAGEAGLRVGEVKALRWREDVDMTARTITVNQQMRRGIVGTPKGRTRRTIPMTETLHYALKRLSAVREGYVIRNLVGQAKHDENQIKNLAYAVCRKAGLLERGWHALRHTFGTHAALFGVNPWRLMTWMGHKRIEETLRYVHVAEAHARELDPTLLAVANDERDPDRRILRLLGARSWHMDGTWSASADQSAPGGKH